MRGQVVRVGQTGVEEWLLVSETAADERPCTSSRASTTWSSAGPRRTATGDSRPDPATARELLDAGGRPGAAAGRGRRCSRTGSGCGRRGRTVRLEAVPHEDGSPGGVVHCYGHGGAGVTLSWGCADDVATLVDAVPAGT